MDTQSLSRHAYKVLLDVASLCCVCFSIGMLYPLAALVFFVLFTFLFLQDATMYLNHYYLICILCGLFVFLPANKLLAVDPLLRLSTPQPTVPYWSVLICRTTISIVYIYAGIAKMNEDWIRGEPLLHWVPRRCRLYPNYCWLLQHPATSISMAWCGLVFDTLCPFFYFAGGWFRILAFIASTFFHLSNMMIFNIGIFPAVMLVISMIYCEPDWPLCVTRVITRNTSKYSTPPTVQREDTRKPLSKREYGTLFALVLFVAVQLFLPIRHVFYPGNVVWNELGHNFSWRMKLRDKIGICHFYVTPSFNEPSTENSRVVKLNRFLTESQIKRMAGRPQLMFQTVDEIVSRYKKAFGQTPKVHVVSMVSVNYRPDQFLLDPTVDYANVTSHQQRQNYILPFVPRDCDSSCSYVVEELKHYDNNEHQEYKPKTRMFHQYNHVELSEAMDFFQRSKTRPMPRSSRHWLDDWSLVYALLLFGIMVSVVALGRGIRKARGRAVMRAAAVEGEGSSDGLDESKKRR